MLDGTVSISADAADERSRGMYRLSKFSAVLATLVSLSSAVFFGGSSMYLNFGVDTSCVNASWAGALTVYVSGPILVLLWYYIVMIGAAIFLLYFYGLILCLINVESVIESLHPHMEALGLQSFVELLAQSVHLEVETDEV